MTSVDVLTPLRLEALAVRRGAPGARVHRTGMGARRSQALDHTALSAGGPVVIAGLCGALDRGLGPGDVVLATEVRGPDATIACDDPSVLAGVLRAAGLTVHVGPIASRRGLTTGRRRRALAAAGALAVDMESAWLAAGIRAHLTHPAGTTRPLAVLRVVVDTPAAELRRPLRTARGGILALRALQRAAARLPEWADAVGPREILLAAPRASCAGVERAIDTVRQALSHRATPVYVRRQIVHNLHVIAELEREGAAFVEELDEVPVGETVIFSAHGVSPAVRRRAAERSLEVIDATCPLVAKVHVEARRFADEDYDIVLVGHRDHDEVEGTLGEAPERTHVVADIADIERLRVRDPERVACLTQTTLAVDDTQEIVAALRRRFPKLVAPRASDICYATQNRQDAVRALAGECDLILVVGSQNSSNSRRLVEVAQRAGCRALLIEDAYDVPPRLLAGVRRLGLTAGASAPEHVVQGVVRALRGLGPATITERAVADERVRFKLPPLTSER